MSAACVHAGLFQPPESAELLPAVLRFWDPVPIHSRPEMEDPYLAMLEPCPKWTVDYENLKKNEFYTNLFQKHSELFKFVSNKTGWYIDDLEYFRYLYKVLYIYKEHNPSLIPSWIEHMDKNDIKTIESLAGLSFAMETFSPQLKRLSGGPFIYKLFEYLDKFVHTNDPLKMVTFSGHDTTISAVLNTMGCFDNYPPEFSATVLWEVYKNYCGNYFVRMFYLKSTKPAKLEPLKLRDCSFDCEYSTYRDLLTPYIVGRKAWEMECNAGNQ